MRDCEFDSDAAVAEPDSEPGELGGESFSIAVTEAEVPPIMAAAASCSADSVELFALFGGNC